MNQLPDDLDVWVLAGQSNMQGCGLLSEALPADERVWCFTSAGQWRTAEEPLHRLWESFTPVHQRLMREGMPEDERPKSDAELATLDARTRQGGAGLGLAFARAVSEAHGKPIGVLPAAHGGTSLEQWNPALKNQGGDSLYGAMLQRIERAGGTLRGVLWYQGESDAGPELSVTYAARMATWIEAVRADTGRPDLPVLLVQLGRFVTPASPEQAHAWDVVREALAVLPDRIPHTAATSAIDLGLVDAIHIDTPGLIQLGNRLARLALAMESTPESTSGSTHESTLSTPAGPRVSRLEAHPGQPGMGAIRVVCENVTGVWMPRRHMSGFRVCDAAGNPHPTLEIVDASTDATNPANIRVLLNGALTADVRLGYGLGMNPYCNVVDEADMPLCAFLPKAMG